MLPPTFLFGAEDGPATDIGRPSVTLGRCRVAGDGVHAVGEQEPPIFRLGVASDVERAAMGDTLEGLGKWQGGGCVPVELWSR